MDNTGCKPIYQIFIMVIFGGSAAFLALAMTIYVVEIIAKRRRKNGE